MILIDTSIWIDFLKPRTNLKVSSDIFMKAVTAPIIIQEVFQGLKNNQASEKFKDAFMALPRVADPTSLADFMFASEIYGLARRKGLTIRSSADCLIAAIAIKNRLEIWHRDREPRQSLGLRNLEFMIIKCKGRICPKEN